MARTGPYGNVPPPRDLIDTNVADCCWYYGQSPLGSLVAVRDTTGTLWIESAPGGQPGRTLVDLNVNAFQVLSTSLLVLRTDSRLWLERPPFGALPANGIEIDANVMVPPAPGRPGALWGTFQTLSPFDQGLDASIFVLGSDGRLWAEEPPFGVVPPPTRLLVDQNVAGFGFYDDNNLLVLGNDGKLWLESPPFSA